MRTLWMMLAALLGCAVQARALELTVDPGGDDAHPGTRERPLRTFDGARAAAREAAGREPVTVTFRAGTYFLPGTVRLGPEDSGAAGAPVVYQAAPGADVRLSGGVPLSLSWEPYRDGILKARVPADVGVIDQLFLNGERLPMARYPDFDPSVRHFNGFAADAFSPERAARWSDPRGAFLHAMHRHEWGDFHFRVTGRDDQGRLMREGGWQNNRRLGIHDRYRMVENVFEELDAPGEWYHHADSKLLYLKPPAGVEMASATLCAVRLAHLVEMRGSPDRPVRFVTLRGFTFQHAARTFMDNKEPLLRSDWTTYRGGAVLFRGAEDCALEDCRIDQVGGNAVFIDGYNRRVTVARCVISGAGANGVALVGDPKAVRNPLFEYEQRQAFEAIDLTPGPKSPDYPADCLVEDCLIFLSGRFEKQTAPVQIAMARRITVRHCSIYDVPRAGINIGDGCWGGHVIEHCDIFDTVKETGDHGSFNSWGRDRYWGLTGIDLNTVTQGLHRNLPLLDMVEPTVIRNNRWRCDHGWDIDLDDGSSAYEIRDNLCLNGGIKLREGFYRVCENNIMVNNSFHPHVWYGGSEDVFRRNIVFTPYRPIQVGKPWGRVCDENLLHRPDGPVEAAAVLREQSGRDERSLSGDALFEDPARGDYRVKEGSPALTLGFRNFAMDRFGVRPAHLRREARTAPLPGTERSAIPAEAARLPVWTWRGARVRELAGHEFSVVGVAADAGGVWVVEVAAGSAAERDGFQKGDFIRTLDGRAVKGLEGFRSMTEGQAPGRVGLRRNQSETELRLSAP